MLGRLFAPRRQRAPKLIPRLRAVVLSVTFPVFVVIIIVVILIDVKLSQVNLATNCAVPPALGHARRWLRRWVCHCIVIDAILWRPEHYALPFAGAAVDAPLLAATIIIVVVVLAEQRAQARDEHPIDNQRLSISLRFFAFRSHVEANFQRLFDVLHRLELSIVKLSTFLDSFELS